MQLCISLHLELNQFQGNVFIACNPHLNLVRLLSHSLHPFGLSKSANAHLNAEVSMLLTSLQWRAHHRVFWIRELGHQNFHPTHTLHLHLTHLTSPTSSNIPYISSLDLWRPRIELVLIIYMKVCTPSFRG